MKRKVSFSTYSIILSISCIIIYSGAMLISVRQGEDWVAYLLGALLVCFSGAALFFMPTSISVEDGSVNINTSLRTKSLPLREIMDVNICPPTMSERRIFGSGGWLGYWGWYSEPSIGKYMAYYGKASDCFLVRLKNGKQYMLSCNDPQSLVDYINSQLPA